MCGLVGTAGSPQNIDVGGVERAVAAMRHRGPDAAGVRTFWGKRSSVALGAVRLRIIDVSPASDQPMVSTDGTVAVSFNGELYNFRELRHDLEARGHRFRTDADTECLIHLYEDHRSDPNGLLTRLRGMFAFAIWDTTTERLLLARDRLGIKPLVYHQSQSGISFASEARALALGGLCPSEPDIGVVNAYLARGVVPRPKSIIAGIEHLPPGHFALWERGRLTVTAWWSPAVAPDSSLTGRTADAELRRVLDDSVRRHLVSDRRLGLFLSSGLDSSVIANLAAPHGQMSALTVAFDGAPDELELAGRMASRLGLQHTAVRVDGELLRDHLMQALGSMDEPSLDAVNSWFVCQAAAGEGLVVALSGLGADELFGGYPSFRNAPRIARLGRVVQLAPQLARKTAGGLIGRRWPGHLTTRVLDSPSTVEGALDAIHRVFGSFELPPALRTSSVPGPRVSRDARSEVSRLEMKHYMAGQLLPDTDSVSMSHSIEVRVPFLDDEVVDLALRLPPLVRFEPGKALLARAVGMAMLPKQPFSLPFDQWLRGPLLEATADALLSASHPFAEQIPESFRLRVWDAFCAGRTHWSRPWSIAVLRLWPAANGLNW